jgi:hypothetical protein
MHHNVVNRINLDPPGPGAAGIFYPSLLMIDDPILKPSLLKHGHPKKPGLPRTMEVAQKLARLIIAHVYRKNIFHSQPLI